VDRLIDTHRLRDKAIVDIGCGRGDLLALFVERGKNRGHGFDPSFSASEDAALPRDVTIRRALFAREHAAELDPALVCCRHVLEHVADPIAFLSEIRQAIAPAASPVLYIEVPSGEQLLRDRAVWDYIYEHYSYFSAQSLQLALSAAGFDVLRLQEDFGGQFLCAEARPSGTVPVGADRRTGDCGLPDIAEAAAAFQGKLARWRAWAGEVSGNDRRATVWGAGSKGVMFLNLLGLSAPQPIDFAIDQNPNKTNRYLAVSGQVVRPPAHLADAQVDEIVVMNPIYRDEIQGRLSALGSSARVVTA
jgi:SAM-dependent methyltransferase